MNIVKESIGYKLHKICSQLQKSTKGILREVGITGDNYITMNYIYENPGITQAELADINQKDRNVIGKTIDKLEAKKLVKRIRGEKDRRSFRLYITETGKGVISKYWSVISKIEEKRLQKLNMEEQIKFVEMLEKISD